MNTSTYEQTFIKEMLNESPFRAFMMIVLVAPIIEEMMFRTLINPSHTEIVLFLIIWPVFFLLRFIPMNVHWGLKIGFTAIFIFSVTYICQQLIPKEATAGLRSWLLKNNLIFWILTSFIFGFVHVNNYVEHFTLNLALFLLILPRILAGLMLGWVKIKNQNLYWAMALHAMNNGMAFFFIYISL
ncbi:MAG: CPBP family intramembrane glutamic endopeptidase [Leeuwenhoekiella sp.]